ncbi:MAG: TIGR02452 family protein [Lachnospiraceae bacterium]|nr:TIGR02452 family protein [Lachnospiraceae bacterium]
MSVYVAVHNFASASNPGGGVANGASAQEECLCRCSGLYFNLNTPVMWDGFYQPHRDAHDPIHNDDIIYTPNVTVFKSDTAMPKLMAEPDWYDVVSGRIKPALFGS